MSTRPSRRIRLLCGAVVASLAVLLPARAFAQLGGDAQSIERVRVQLKASVTVTPMGRYAIHEMKAESGATLREFASPEGRIFGVAWDGPFHPDYQQVLGPYFAQLQQAMQERRARREPVTIRTPDFVFQTYGHLHALGGRAFLPQMLPVGVTPEEVQ